MAKRQAAKERTNGAKGGDLLTQLGRLLNQTRRSKDDTLTEAAIELGMASEVNSNAKANVHNIESGSVFLPWRRVVAFADYTQRDPGAILIALATARAIKEIQDPEERDKLLARLKKLLHIDSLDELMGIADELSVEGYRKKICLPPTIAFWDSFRERFPWITDLQPKLASRKGSYNEEPLSKVFEPAARRRYIVHSAGTDGVELSLLQFFDTSRELLFPVYIDADSIQDESLVLHIENKVFQKSPGLEHLSLQSTDIRQAAFFVFHNIPIDGNKLNRLRGLIVAYLRDNPITPLVIITDQLATCSELEEFLCFDFDFKSFITVPISEADALAAFRNHLRKVGLLNLSHDLPDWLYSVLRNPLWSGILSQLCRDTRSIPTQWETVRALASNLLLGVRPETDLREGLYPTLVGKTASAHQKLILQLVSSAAASLENSLHQAPLELKIDKDVQKTDLIKGPLLQRSDAGAQSFSSTWIHCYFSALHYLRKVTQAKRSEKPVQAMLKSLNDIYEKGDYQKVLSTYVALTLLDEAERNQPKIYEELLETFNRTNTDRAGTGLSISRRVLSLRGGETFAQIEGNKLCKKRPVKDAGQKEKLMYLRVMIEDQAPGWALRSMANTDTLRTANPGKDDAMIVRPVLAAYEIVREAIDNAIKYSKGDKTATHPNVDVIICPHYSLAWALAESGSLIPLSAAEIPSLTRLGFLANHYCKFQDQWVGIPFQYPTKYLCYRNDLIKTPPSSFDELLGLIEEQKGEKKVRAGLGLQARPYHASLYYEWLAIVAALGGGDVLWDSTIRDGEVILDSEVTVDATLKFLNLFNKAHPQSSLWDWDGIIHAMADDEIAMCLPFSDTVPELSRLREHKKHREQEQGSISLRSDLSYAPLRLGGGKPSYGSQKLYGYAGVPLHIFTGHVMVALNEDEEMVRRETRFMQWFLDEQTQREFSARIFQSPYLDGEPTLGGETDLARYSGGIAQDYAYLPMQSPFTENESEEQLPAYQNMVLVLVSKLLQAGEYRPEVVKRQLEETAAAIRTQFKFKRRKL